MHDEDDDIDSMDPDAFMRKVTAEMALLKARSVDEAVSRPDRLQAAEELLAIRMEARRMMQKMMERLVRDAYGERNASPSWQGTADSILIEAGLVTQTDLDRQPMDEVLMQVRQRLADRGFVDDTGLAG